MVSEEEKPNLFDASCCKVEVVKGGKGFFFMLFLSRLCAQYSFPLTH